MSRIDRLLAAMVLVALLFMCGTFVLIRDGRAKDVPLLIDDEALRLGNVWSQEEYPWSFPISNQLEVPVSVVLSSSCRCSTPEPSTFLLQPNEETDIQLKLDLRPVNGQIYGEPSYPLQAQLKATFESAQGKGVMAWDLAGDVHQVLAVSPRVLDFADKITVSNSSATAEPVRAKIRPFVDLTEIDLDCDESKIMADVVQLEDGNWELSVVPSETLPVGSFETEVRLRTRSGATVFPTVIIPCQGKGLRDIRADPNYVDYGVVYSGELARTSLCLHSARVCSFTIGKIEVPECIKVLSTRTAENRTSYELDLALCLRESGPWESNVHIEVVDIDGVTYLLDVPVRAYTATK